MRGFVGICRHGMRLLALLALPATAVAVTNPSITDFSNVEAETQQPPQSPATPRAARAVQVRPPQSDNPLWGVPIKQLSKTRDRPIFSPSRRPPAPAVVAAPSAVVIPPVQKPKEPERPQLSLLGTIVNGNDGYGIFMDQATKATVRVRIGASYQGWTLRSLQTGVASLDKGLDHVVLALPKRAGEPEGGFTRMLSAAGAKSLSSWGPGWGSMTRQLPASDSPIQPNGFPQIGPLFGNGPPPPIEVHN